MADNIFSVEGKIALVSGASSGLGEHMAELLAANGVAVVCAARRVDRLERLAERITAKGGRALAVAMDVTDRASVKAALNAAESTFGTPDIIVCNAGATGGQPFLEMEEAVWDHVLAVNLKGVFNLAQEGAQRMVAAGKSGSIINISSIAGKQIYANGAVYCASKAAVEVLSQGMRIDLNPFGIKVSNLAPGAVNTEFSAVRFKGDVDKVDAVYKGFEPLVAKDVAEVLRFMVMAPAHVNLSDVTLLPTAQASANLINRI